VNLAITGANSGVGNILLRHLAGRTDIQVVACVRSAGAAAALHAAPGISVRQVDYDDRDRLTAALQGAACVVHLAGILFESASSTYQTANVDATEAVVDACRKAGVPHIVLISVLGADPGSPNRFWRSKGRAERLVAESGLPATIIRTPILLGPGMAGARAVVHAASQRSVALLGGGRHSVRPLDVDDLSRAMAKLWMGEAIAYKGRRVALSIMNARVPITGTLVDLTHDGLLIDQDGAGQVAVSYSRLSGIDAA